MPVPCLFFAIDLPFLVVPLNFASTETKLGRSCQGSSKTRLPTHRHRLEDVPVSGAPSIGMSGFHSGAPPANLAPCWLSIFDFLQTAPGEDRVIEARVLD